MATWAYANGLLSVHRNEFDEFDLITSEFIFEVWLKGNISKAHLDAKAHSDFLWIQIIIASGAVMCHLSVFCT